jgi:indolepyruvate ferredoxin oxidoreductase beta subunit
VGRLLVPLAERIRREFPAAAHRTLIAGIERLADYQDIAYAESYLDRLKPVAEIDRRRADGGARLLDETARYLALWMSYEDTIRVADLKTRRSRFERVRGEVRSKSGQLLGIHEFMHPRVEEIADTLPEGLGRWLLGTPWARRLVGRFAHEGRVVKTSTVRGFLLLYCVASLRGMRRRTLRFRIETARIDSWLATVLNLAATDYDLAVAVAECQRLVKGYGDTHVRGWRNFEAVMAALPRLKGRPDAAAQVRRLRDAALADEHGNALATVREELAA